MTEPFETISTNNTITELQDDTQDVGSINSLMLPITIGGQAYLASQRIHQDYIRNTQERGEKPKYQRHTHFVRVIKEIPSYDLYVLQRDILHYEWEAVRREKSERNQFLVSLLKPLFAAAGYNQLTLLNHKAQLELTHHLDDELNQEIAYRHTSLATADPDTLRNLFLRQFGFLPYESLYDFMLIREFCRVWGVKVPLENDGGRHWPGVGNLFNQFVYGIFPENIQDELNSIPRTTSGKLQKYKHQKFEEPMRDKALRRRQDNVIALLRICDDGEKDLFIQNMERHDRRIGLSVEVTETVNVRLKKIDSRQLTLFEGRVDENGNGHSHG